jgi:hypothetical protein
VNNGPWTAEEDQLLITLTAQIGPKWSQLVPYFTDRTDVNLKNRSILLDRKRKRFVKSVSRVLSSEQKKKLADPAEREAVLPLLETLIGGFPDLQPKRIRKARDGPPTKKLQEPSLSWEWEINSDDSQTSGTNCEFDLGLL